MEPNWHLARKRQTLIQRARIIQQIRAFFIKQHFLEVETPQRLPANAPELHIDAVQAEGWFLQTSPELCMKRLLAANYGPIFQICHCWRSGERGQRHLPEYTMLEWYHPDKDYQQLMTDCEMLLQKLIPDNKITYNGSTIDITPPWPRMTITEAFARYSPVSLDEALTTDQFDIIVSTEIEPNLPVDKPLFMLDYPLEQAALARKKLSDNSLAERVELYIGGLELANGFSELNNKQEQELRFRIEEQNRRKRGKTPYPTPQIFLDELDNLPEAAGIALGIDRLVMMLCNQTSIDQVVCFTPEQL